MLHQWSWRRALHEQLRGVRKCPEHPHQPRSRLLRRMHASLYSRCQRPGTMGGGCREASLARRRRSTWGGASGLVLTGCPINALCLMPAPTCAVRACPTVPGRQLPDLPGWVDHPVPDLQCRLHRCEWPGALLCGSRMSMPLVPAPAPAPPRRRHPRGLNRSGAERRSTPLAMPPRSPFLQCIPNTACTTGFDSAPATDNCAECETAANTPISPDPRVCFACTSPLTLDANKQARIVLVGACQPWRRCCYRCCCACSTDRAFAPFSPSCSASIARPSTARRASPDPRTPARFAMRASLPCSAR